LFNVIAGRLHTDLGPVIMDGEDITGLPPHELFHKGLLRTFQIAHEFGSMTVRENLMMVPPRQTGETLWNTWFARGRIREEEKALRQKADEVLEFLTISHVADEKAGNLSGGQKKLLELGRTMMVDAKIVFLDEVGAGVNRTLLNTIGDAIVRLNKERGYTFCVIEHDMDFIGRLCDPVIVHGRGQGAGQGSADSIMQNEAVIEAYLGRGLKNKEKAHGEGGRGSRDASMAEPGRDSWPPTGEKNMTGGYGRGRHPAQLHHAVEKGEIAVIVGPNGAGKSTAMKAVFGMLNLREGSVRLAARTSPN
jgi:branched-chain amino acid transport system ATP-binding protein